MIKELMSETEVRMDKTVEAMGEASAPDARHQPWWNG
jgi:hypothetical protein